jgi:hypothetical protein
MLPAKFGSIWPSSFRGEDFFNIRNKNFPWGPYLLAEWDEMKKLYLYIIKYVMKGRNNFFRF